MGMGNQGMEMGNIPIPREHSHIQLSVNSVADVTCPHPQFTAGKLRHSTISSFWGARSHPKDTGIWAGIVGSVLEEKEWP